jgi:hypothetical protein
MKWWLDRGMPESAEKMDAIYHELVWSGAVVRRKTTETP